jgi:Spy/CpxP family protein refolding chaperone
MNDRRWKFSWMTLLMVAGLASMSMAQDGTAAASRGSRSGSGRGAFGFVATLERQVGLTPEQRDAVRGLLAEQRQKSQAMREETDNKIRALLNPDQQKKFDEVVAELKNRSTRKNQGA